MCWRTWIVILFFLAACASTPHLRPQSTQQPHTFVQTTRYSGPHIQLASAQTDSPQQLPIGKADLAQARAMLRQAHTELEPRQWEALNGRLTAAEQAFERFSDVSKASGQIAEVARGAEGAVQAGRAETSSPRAGPLLGLLVMLWPAELASAELDHAPSQEWFEARKRLQKTLRDVSEESRRVESELARHAPAGATTEDAEPDLDSAPFMAAREPKTWRNTVDPATGSFYTSVEEYDRVSRNQEQTCKNSRLDTLRAERDALYNSVPSLDPKRPDSKNKRWYPMIPCSRIRLRLAAMQKVLDKRREIQRECFGGKSDTGHDAAKDEVNTGIENLKLLEATNCAPGHPMADE